MKECCYLLHSPAAQRSIPDSLLSHVNTIIELVSSGDSIMMRSLIRDNRSFLRKLAQYRTTMLSVKGMSEEWDIDLLSNGSPGTMWLNDLNVWMSGSNARFQILARAESTNKKDSLPDQSIPPFALFLNISTDLDLICSLVVLQGPLLLDRLDLLINHS